MLMVPPIQKIDPWDSLCARRMRREEKIRDTYMPRLERIDRWGVGL
jgi:hypothetical protein